MDDLKKMLWLDNFNLNRKEKYYGIMVLRYCNVGSIRCI